VIELLEKAIERLRELPTDVQDRAAAALMWQIEMEDEREY
jgi:hypothetical protein